MAIDVLPFPDIFKACYQVLQEKLVPLHYVQLTELALQRLGLSRSDVNWQRQIEDVREKFVEAGRNDTFYTGAPLCLAGLRWWFPINQLRLLRPTEGIIIEGNAQCGADGAFKALMRDPYMKIKSQAQIEWVKMSRANGLVIEEHVANWFKAKWPDFYQPPDNEGVWSAWCDHDFKLNIDGKVFKVDVFGQRLNGHYGNPGNGKRRVDLHLACKIVGQNVLWEAIYTSRTFDSLVFAEFGLWPEMLVVFLNCKKAGIDYQFVKSYLMPEKMNFAA